ncbi:ZZ-type zinc finger-containing protein 3 [Crotalus adamanteus]|uniref:ZZ-type zinc finger-containing protein 3 n=1 Tax=Crotalus adamanteus TaxID=8729 RepID=A0AAW1BQ61_CROAD
MEEEEEEPDVYYFESDHVALKHNKDYQRLLQTIAVLEAQRTQAVQDLESLGRHQREALKDPIGFVESLQKKVDVELPFPQRVVKLPEVSWDQYTTSLGNFEREFKNRKRNSRRAKLIFDKGLPTRPKSPLDPRKDGETTSYSVLPFSDCPEASMNNRPQMIRGRLCDETKPETFNQLWTIEEQKKLEQLLLKYPPEEIESRRWQKIADELGNRTAKQVASRVQKYFIKLTKAGIPVPGRTPNLYLYSKKSSNRRQHPLNKHLFKPSTFMTSHEPPVFMDEDDDRSCFHSHIASTVEEEPSDEESIPIAYRELPEYKELLKFKKLRKQKMQQMHAESGFVQHIGFKCDNCGTDPIQGIRWHCQDCPAELSLDFCDSCSDCLHETDIHKENHRLEPIYRAEMMSDNSNPQQAQGIPDSPTRKKQKSSTMEVAGRLKAKAQSNRKISKTEKEASRRQALEKEFSRAHQPAPAGFRPSEPQAAWPDQFQAMMAQAFAQFMTSVGQWPQQVPAAPSWLFHQAEDPAFLQQASSESDYEDFDLCGFLSDDEDVSPPDPAPLTGLFDQSLFDSLLLKVCTSANIALEQEAQPVLSTAKDPNPLYSEPVVTQKPIPCSPLLLQYGDMAEPLKAEDKKFESAFCRSHQALAWAVKASTSLAAFAQASIIWLRELQDLLPPDQVRAHQNLGKLVATSQYMADASHHAARCSWQAAETEQADHWLGHQLAQSKGGKVPAGPHVGQQPSLCPPASHLPPLALFYLHF